jgi:hypothetical protein
LEFQTCVSSKLGIAICALVESLVCRLYHSAKLDVGVTLAHPELGMEAVGAAAPPQSKIKKNNIFCKRDDMKDFTSFAPHTECYRNRLMISTL